jgi:TRAP-type C4-dicarboxylate transport system permease small subunit
MYAPLPLGGAITALQGVIETIEALRRPRAPPPEEAAVVE